MLRFKQILRIFIRNVYIDIYFFGYSGLGPEDGDEVWWITGSEDQDMRGIGLWKGSWLDQD